METNYYKNVKPIKQGFNFTTVIKVGLILFLSIISIGKSFAQLEKLQSNLNSSTTFQDIYVPEKQYLDNLKLTLDSTTYYCGGAEYKTFKKFQNFWESRLYPNKTFETYFLAQQAFYENTSQNYSNASSDTWKEIGPKNSAVGIGPVEFITFFDNGTPVSTQYMLTGATQSGLFYSKDFGETWSPAGTDTQWESSGCSWAVFHPTNHQIWCASSSGNGGGCASSWMGRSGGVYLTSDEGQTWLKKADYLDFGEWTIIRKLIWDASNTNRLYVATSFGLYKTEDINSPNPTWTKILAYDINDIELKPGSNNTMFSACSEKINDNLFRWRIMKSVDYGTSWTEIYTSDNTTLTIETSKAKPDYLYMCKLSGYTASLSYFYNSTWTNIINSTNMPFGAGHAFGVEQVQNGESLIISYGTGLKRLTITGSTLTSGSSVHVDLEDVVYHPYNTNEVWICTHGGPEKSVNSGSSWTAKYNGVGTAITTKMATSYTNPEYVMLGLYHDGTQITRTPYSNNWNPNWQVVYWGDGNQPLIDNKEPKYMWASPQGGGFCFSDNFLLNGCTSYISTSTYWYTQGVLNKENSNFLYANHKPIYSESKEEVKRFTSRGVNTGSIISNFKSLLDPSITQILTIGMVTPFNSNNELIVWVDARGGTTGNGFHVFRTRNATDANPTWIELSIPRTGWINEIEFNPYNSNIVYLCYSNSTDESQWPLSKQLIYKVDYTNPSSPVFTDLTKNLPYAYTGSYCLDYERGSDGVLYLATDFGIYTTNNQLLTTNNSWQLVGRGFPHCASSQGIEINYPKNLIRAGTGGRGAWEIPLPCSNETSKIIINQNTSWNTIERLNKGVIVKSGYTLTINQNARISFPVDDGIIVEPGAKLIVNGATLLNSCTNSQWQGIQVWGNKNANQFPDANGNYQQGYLELNNAIIENAVCAVDLWKPEDYSKTGGILKATNSIFRNNAKSIHALHYKNTHPYHPEWEMNYNGSVKNCTFEITTDYIPTTTFYKHVDLANIRGFSFSGSDFTLAPNVAGVNDWNSGIAAYSAGFSVQATCTSATQPCSTYDKCKFSGFRYGIDASHAGFSVNTFTVNRAEFENNIYGINVKGIKSETILNSDFKVGYNSTPGCPAVSGYGIYLDNSTGFAIEENTFTKMPNAPVANYTGIHVNNSQGVNDIYKNSFSNLSFGNNAYWTNWEGSTNTGLEYLCNNNQNNWADFYIPFDQINANNIQSFQGSYLLSAGNIFSQTDNTWHFYNGGGSGVTYHYNGNSPFEPNQGKLFNVAKSVSNSANQCPSHYGGNGNLVLNVQDKLLRENQYAYNLVNYNNVKTLHDQLRDGGSTQERVSDIETAQPQDMWALRAELLGVSPHLSEEVLRKVADKTDVFTESVIFDILAANPDELRKEELLQYLENKENPLPSYMVDILRQVAEGETYRTVLEKQMSMYRKEMTRAANDMIRSYLNDSVTDYNALRGWLDNLGGIEADKQIIATYLQEGNYQQASALANMLPTLYNLSGDVLSEHERYMALLNLHQTLQTENRHFGQLTANEKAMLENYANNGSGSSSAAAKGILATYYNAQFVDCMQAIEPASLKRGAVSPEDLAKVYGMEISVKPNPASDWAAFDYTLPDMDETATLQITDMTGKIIETITLSGKQGQKLWDTRPIKAGVYLYTMKAGIKSLSGKITIIK